MPEDDKPKNFKAVTEEILPTPSTGEEPSVAQPQAATVPELGPAVKETNNIDLTSKPNDTGAFLKIFLVTFFATLLAFLLAGGVYVYLTGKSVKSKQQAATVNTIAETPAPTSGLAVASPSAVPTTDYSSFKVSVLNGNGGIGVATAAKTIIEKAGFKVSSVGNADNFNFTNTIIQVKSSVPANVVAALKNALGASYSVKIGDQLDPADNFDIVVTVGSS